RVLEKERALFRKAQVESRKVDLLGIDLDLGEVGVVGQIEVEARRQPDLGVAADVPIQFGRRSGKEVSVGRADDVGKDLEIARRLQFEPPQFAGGCESP